VLLEVGCSQGTTGRVERGGLESDALGREGRCEIEACGIMNGRQGRLRLLREK
jgi:hypothetical protein